MFSNVTFCGPKPKLWRKSPRNRGYILFDSIPNTPCVKATWYYCPEGVLLCCRGRFSAHPSVWRMTLPNPSKLPHLTCGGSLWWWEEGRSISISLLDYDICRECSGVRVLMGGGEVARGAYEAISISASFKWKFENSQKEKKRINLSSKLHY